MVTLLGAKPCFRSSLRDGRAVVSPVLTQLVEDLAFVVDGAPEIDSLAGDPDHHLVKLPAIARPTTAQPQPSRNHRAEFRHPATDARVGEVEPTLCKQFLDITIAQGEAQVEPHRVLNHGWRKLCRR